MPKFIRVTRAFTYDLEGGERRTLPAGWAGTVEDAVAQNAIEAGAASGEDGGTGAALGEAEGNEGVAPTVEADATAADATAAADAAADEVSEDMSRDELDRRARAAGLDPSNYRTKADLVAALRGRG